MRLFKWTAGAAVVGFMLSGIVTCGMFYGWGLPIVTLRKTTTLVGPDNRVYLLLVHRAARDEIMAAAKSDLASTFSFCNYGDTLLTVAVSEGRPDVVEGLLDLGMSPNSPGGCAGSPFNPPLVVAVMRDEAKSVKLLLDRGADPQLPDTAGLSAKDMLELADHAPEVKALVEAALRSTSKPSATAP